MKKFLYNILLMLFMLLPFGVLAEGYISVSTNSLTIEKGDLETFELTAYNTIGDVFIESNDINIATVDTNEWSTGMVEEKIEKTGIIAVTGNSIGTTTITLTMDAATFDEDDLSGETKTITVNVVEKQINSNDHENPKTGMMFKHMFLIIIIIVANIIYFAIKRKSKFLKHN